VSRGLHTLTVLSLAMVGIGTHPNHQISMMLYWAGVLVVAALLLYEHSLVKPGDLSKLDAAFFTMNGVISLLFFGFVLAGRLVAVWSHSGATG